MARRCIKTKKSDGTIRYYYTDDETINILVGDCIVTSNLIVDANSVNFNSAQTCTQTTVVKQGYSWNSTSGNKGYIIYALVPSNITFQARLFPLNGQADVTPTYQPMEIGSWSGPNGINWNRRMLINPIYAGGIGVASGTWKQVLLNTATNLTNERSVVLVDGQTIDNVELPEFISTPTPTTPANAPLELKILSYDCNVGLLQCKLTGGNGTSISVSLPGVIDNIMPSDSLFNHLFTAEERVGKLVTGTISQSGITINISFTTSCNLVGVSTPTPTPSLTPTPTPTPTPTGTATSNPPPVTYPNDPIVVGALTLGWDYVADDKVQIAITTIDRNNGFFMIANIAPNKDQVTPMGINEVAYDLSTKKFPLGWPNLVRFTQGGSNPYPNYSKAVTFQVF